MFLKNRDNWIAPERTFYQKFLPGNTKNFGFSHMFTEKTEVNFVTGNFQADKVEVFCIEIKQDPIELTW